MRGISRGWVGDRGRVGDATGRILAFDVLRAVALAAMVASHTTTFGGQTLLERVAALPRWIDGAFIFVPLSGVVTGLVHRRVVDARGVRASRVKLVRRAAFIYAVHVALTLVIVTAATGRHVRSFGAVPTWSEAGGLPGALLDIMRFKLMLSFNDVLPMYVFFLVLALAYVGLLRRGRWPLVAALSLAIYAFSQAIDGLAVKADSFHVAAWQLPFTAGFLVGWSWHHGRLRVVAARRRQVVRTAVGLSSAIFVSARVAPATMTRVFGRSLDKMTGGWLAFLYAGSAIVAGYAAIERARRLPVVARALRTFRILGAKGLPGFATMVLAIVVLDMLPSVPRTDPVILCVYGACFVSELFALRLDLRRRTRRVSAPITQPAASALVADGVPAWTSATRAQAGSRPP